ncbi:FkbM family methyltransferase [Candidatus Parvarchaeota archaeon]|nr:FkbM family methyltransferase [Candidatus Parvarchaeota archaeon]
MVSDIARKLLMTEYLGQGGLGALRRLWLESRLLLSGARVVRGKDCIWIEKGSGKSCRRLKIKGDSSVTTIAKTVGLFESIMQMVGGRQGNEVDLTGDVEIDFLGCRIATDFWSLLEIESALMQYNKFYKLREGDIVFDCGGFHGMYSIYASKQVGSSGKVYCFEPDSQSLKVIEKNINGNGITNVKVVKKGIWDKTAKLPWSNTIISSIDPNAATLGGTGGGQGASANTAEGYIDVVSIPEFCLQEGIEKIDFIKMDIEGAEIEVLQSLADYLRQHKVNLAIASYHIRDGAKTSNAIEKMMRPMPYRAITANLQHRTTYLIPL